MRKLFRVTDWPVRGKIAALILVASILPLSIASFVDIRESQKQMMADTDVLLAARADQLAKDMDSFHRGYLRSVAKLALLPEVIAFSPAASGKPRQVNPELDAILRGQETVDPGIRGTAILDSSGTVTAATEDRLVGANLAYHSYIREALRGATVISDLHLAEPEVSTCRRSRTSRQCAVQIKELSDWQLSGCGRANCRTSRKVITDLPAPTASRCCSTTRVSGSPGGRLDSATLEAQVAERRFGTNTRQLLEDVRAFPEQYKRARSARPDTGMFRGWAPVNGQMNYGSARRLQTVPWTLFHGSGALDRSTRERAGDAKGGPCGHLHTHCSRCRNAGCDCYS
jgi:hypothetical protein